MFYIIYVYVIHVRSQILEHFWKIEQTWEIITKLVKHLRINTLFETLDIDYKEPIFNDIIITSSI